MIKKLVKILCFGLLVLLISKSFIAFNVHQAITKLKDKHNDDLLLTYQWISSSFDGAVSIKGVQITPYSMKRTYKIDEIRFVYEDYLSLLTKLSNLANADLVALKKIALPSIRTELSGKSMVELLSDNLSPISYTPFNLYACGKHTALSAEEYELMGITQHSMSLQLSFDQSETELDQLTLDLDRKELGAWRVSASLPKHALQRAIKNKDYAALKLHFLSVAYQDAGFFRRLNILCNQGGAENRAIFSLKAAAQWKDAMFAKGMLINEVMIKSYSDYLQQGGTISIEAHDENGFNFKELTGLLDTELFSQFDAKLAINGNVIKNSQLYLDSASLFPPVVSEIKTQPSIPEVAKQPTGYRPIALEFVAEHIDRKIRVTMQDGKLYEGLLSKTTQYNLELTQNLPGGAVHYPLMLNQIESFEVWFNQEQ